MSVQEVFDTLCNDNKFLTSLETAIKNIIKNNEDGNIDIVDIIFVITSCYNEFTTMKIIYSDLPQLLEKLFFFIIDKYKLLSPNELQYIETKLKSAIKLVMLQPNIHQIEEEIEKVSLSLFKKIFFCFK